MKINIQATNTELTGAIRAYVEEKLSSLDKLIGVSGDGVMAEVDIGKVSKHHNKGDVFRAEINLTVSGNLYRAEKVDQDLYAAIDAVRDELANELRRAKGKGETMFRRGARIVKNLLRGFGN